MSFQKDRIDTIISLIASNRAFSGTGLNKIKTEYRQVLDMDSINPIRRRNLFKILHSSRALDSSLKIFLDYHRIRNGKNALGQYLFQLHLHRHSSLASLSAAERSRYQNSIVSIRNELLHEADSYPGNDRQVNSVISEMEALISRLVTL